MSDSEIPCPNCNEPLVIRRLKKDWQFSGYCPGCGALVFGPVDLLERVRNLKGNKELCPHHEPLKPCKNNSYTSWCPRCRLRLFVYKLINLQLPGHSKR